MGSTNRGRYVVQLGQGWRLYTNAVPAGWKALGVIDRGGQRGALVQSPAGILCDMCGGAIRSLDDAKVRAAIAAADPAEVRPVR